VLIPYGTARKRRRFPWVTLGIAAACAAVELYATSLSGPDFVAFAHTWGFTGEDLSRLYTAFTMMWIHDPSGPLHIHIVSNLWALLVFGPQVEDALGHWLFAAYYIAGGLASCVAHTTIASIAHLDSAVPMIGASGAVMGVLGIFAVRFYSTPVNTVVFVVPGIRVPAVIFLAVYLGFGIRAGIINTFGYRISAGVAHWAHIGGFVFGAAAGVLQGVVRHARREYIIERPVDSEEDRAVRLHLLRGLIHHDPLDAEAHLRLATLLDADHVTHGQAPAHYSAALRQFVAEGELGRALAACSALKEGGHAVDDLDPTVAVAVASAYERAGRSSEALDIYAAVARREGTPERILEQALIRRAALLLTAEDHHNAAIALEELLDRCPFSPLSSWAKAALSRLTSPRARSGPGGPSSAGVQIPPPRIGP
jgi:membrane associated rhomboid family serine protease